MSEVSKIIERMKNQRLGRPIRPNMVTQGVRRGEAFSGRVVPIERPKVKVTVNKLLTQCKTFSKKGAGAAAMTVPELTDFIKKRAPPTILSEFSRMQKKTRPALCDLLTKFEEGQELLYPRTGKVNTPPNGLPNANNLEGMFALATRLNAAQRKKNIAKIVERKEALGGFNIMGSPASPASLSGRNSNSPNTPNFANYGNNTGTGNNSEQRVRERNAYLRKLANKRVEKDPLNSYKMSAANMKRFKVQPLKGSKRTYTARKPTTPTKTNLAMKRIGMMNFDKGNMRVLTKATGGLVVSKNPRVNAATMRQIKNQAAQVRNTLSVTLAQLRSIPVKNRSAVTRMRIRFLARRLADPKFNNRFVNSEVYRATLMHRLGLESPPAPRSPNKKSFSAGATTSTLRPEQTARLAKIMKGKAKKNETSVNVNAIKQVVKKFLARKSLQNYKIDGKPCMSIKKSKLVKIARLFTGGKLINLDTLTKEELCKIIKENRGNK